MHCLYQVNIYLYHEKGKICVQCLVYSPCCLLLCLWVMDNMLFGANSVTYFSIFQHNGIFISLSRIFRVCSCLVNICLTFLLPFFLLCLTLFSPLITEVIFLKEIKQVKKKSNNSLYILCCFCLNFLCITSGITQDWVTQQ